MIIDTHTHIGIIPPFDMPVENLLYSMERYGIDFSLISNIEAVEFDHHGIPVPPEYQKPQTLLLRETIAAARLAPGRLGVLPWLKIAGELPDNEFVSLIKENRDIIFGLKLHPFHSRTAPDDERLEPVYRLAAEFDLPIVSHTGGCEEAMTPRQTLSWCIWIWERITRRLSICSESCPICTATPHGSRSKPLLRRSGCTAAEKCCSAPTIP